MNNIRFHYNQLFYDLIFLIKENNLNFTDLKSSLSEKDVKFSAFSSIYNLDKKLNLAVLVTKESLPLYDILIKNQTKEINTNIKIKAPDRSGTKQILLHDEVGVFLLLKNCSTAQTKTRAFLCAFFP